MHQLRRLFAYSILIVLLASCGPAKLTVDELETADFGTLPSNWKDLTIQEFNRTHNLYDPMSAQYGFSEPQKSRDGKVYGYRVTLFVNAKNRMGGYTGDEGFIYSIHNSEVRQIDVFSSTMINSLNK